MANLAIQNVSPVFVAGPLTHIRPGLAGVGGLGYGMAVYLDPATGSYLPASSATAAQGAFRGIVTSPVAGAAKGQAVSVLEQGYVAGFDLSALPFDAPVYLSDAPGQLSSTPGTAPVTVGRVAALTDFDPSTNLPSKVLYVRPSAF